MLEQAISWLNNLKGKVTYSMVKRNGPDSYDCSSAIYHSLIAAGIFPSSIAIGNTDTLFNDLERHGFTQVAEQADGSIPTQRGDVFIWGTRGQSAGAFGHTGMFIDADNIIHCSYGYNGIAVSNHDWLWGINGKPEVTIYRLTGNTEPNNPTDQVIEIGSSIRFDNTYTVNDIQLISSTWQVKTDELCKNGFTWDDNGIPTVLLTEVDSDGYATNDQELAIGSLYKIPGKFNVLDVGQTNGEWIAQIGAGGMTFWVDIATATEIDSSNPGTPVPSQRQTNADVPAAMPTPTPITPVIPVPVVIPPTPEPVSSEPVVTPETPQIPTSVPTVIEQTVASSFSAWLISILKSILTVQFITNLFKKGN